MRKGDRFIFNEKNLSPPFPPVYIEQYGGRRIRYRTNPNGQHKYSPLLARGQFDIVDLLVAYALGVDVVTGSVNKNDVLRDEWAGNRIGPHGVGSSAYVIDRYRCR